MPRLRQSPGLRGDGLASALLRQLLLLQLGLDLQHLRLGLVALLRQPLDLAVDVLALGQPRLLDGLLGLVELLPGLLLFGPGRLLGLERLPQPALGAGDGAAAAALLLLDVPLGQALAAMVADLGAVELTQFLEAVAGLLE